MADEADNSPISRQGNTGTVVIVAVEILWLCARFAIGCSQTPDKSGLLFLFALNQYTRLFPCFIHKPKLIFFYGWNSYK
jgi:hypothetical protein